MVTRRTDRHLHLCFPPDIYIDIPREVPDDNGTSRLLTVIDIPRSLRLFRVAYKGSASLVNRLSMIPYFGQFQSHVSRYVAPERVLVIRRERNCFADKSIRVIGRYEFGGTLGRSDPFGDDVAAFFADRRISEVQIQPIPTFCLIKNSGVSGYVYRCLCAGTAG